MGNSFPDAVRIGGRTVSQKILDRITSLIMLSVQFGSGSTDLDELGNFSTISLKILLALFLQGLNMP